MISKKYLLLLFIFIVLLLIFGGYYLSNHLNKSLTSTSSPFPRQPPGTLGKMCVKADYDSTFTATAPPGTHFTKLLFADYGQPTACPNPVLNKGCSATYYIVNTWPEELEQTGFPLIINTDTFNGTTINGSKSLSIYVNDKNMGIETGMVFVCGNRKWLTCVLEYVYE
jgi:hypothetical protein